MAIGIGDWLQKTRDKEELKQKMEAMKHDLLYDLQKQNQWGAFPDYQHEYEAQAKWQEQMLQAKMRALEEEKKRRFGEVDAEIVKTNGIYEAPLSAVCNLWAARNPGWYCVYDLHKETNEEVHFIYQRLLDNDCFEKVSTRNNGMLVRLKE